MQPDNANPPEPTDSDFTHPNIRYADYQARAEAGDLTAMAALAFASEPMPRPKPKGQGCYWPYGVSIRERYINGS